MGTERIALSPRFMSQNLMPRTFGQVGVSPTLGIGSHWLNWLGVTIAPCELLFVVLESTFPITRLP